jgi:hypothetical protein
MAIRRCGILDTHEAGVRRLSSVVYYQSALWVIRDGTSVKGYRIGWRAVETRSKRVLTLILDVSSSDTNTYYCVVIDS